MQEKKNRIRKQNEGTRSEIFAVKVLPVSYTHLDVYKRQVEVQFRTIAMDFWASLEHKLRYKKSIPADHAQQIAQQLLACAQIIGQMDDQMLAIRRQIEHSRQRADWQ